MNSSDLGVTCGSDFLFYAHLHLTLYSPLPISLPSDFLILKAITVGHEVYLFRWLIAFLVICLPLNVFTKLQQSLHLCSAEHLLIVYIASK